MHPYVPRSIRQLRRLLKGMPIGMLTTQTSGGGSHSRPMLVHEVAQSVRVEPEPPRDDHLSIEEGRPLCVRAGHGGRRARRCQVTRVVESDIACVVSSRQARSGDRPRGFARRARRVLVGAAIAPRARHRHRQSNGEWNEARGGQTRSFGSASVACMKA
jgi:hypothetical protein